MVRNPKWILFMLSFSFSLYASPSRYEIPNVPYYDMTGGFCTPTAIRMNLKFHGVDAPASVIQNLGWDYGFHLRVDSGRILAFPTTDPVQQIVHAAEQFGFKAELLTHPSVTAAQESLKNLISQNIPVLVQWIPHTVLAYGYSQNGATVRIHDPKDLITPFPGGPFGKGAAVQSRPSQWTQPPALWGLRQHLLAVLHPTEQIMHDWKKFDWNAIWMRNARRTLGGESRGEFFGVAALREISKNFNQYLQMDPRAFDLTFYFAMTSRKDAGIFLRTWDSPDLKAAGDLFLAAAEKAQAIHDSISKQRTENVPSLIKDIADLEERAAEILNSL